MEIERPRSLRRQMVLGLIVGVAVSVFPIEFSFLGGAVALAFLLKRRYGVALAIAFVVCVAAVLLPFDRYSRKVGPFSYGPMTVGELQEKLHSEHGIPLIVDPSLKTNVVILSVSERVSRREVLEQLAGYANARIKYRSCGSGATMLFGTSRMAFLNSAETKMARSQEEAER